MKYYKLLLFVLITSSILLCLFLNLIFNNNEALLLSSPTLMGETKRNLLLMSHLRQLLPHNVEPFNVDNVKHDFPLNAIVLQQTLMNTLEMEHDDMYMQKEGIVAASNRTITIIFSSWRTGSTFLGDIINTVPATYYHYEPFNYRSVEQQETTIENAKHVLKLIKCQYDTEALQQHIDVDAHWHYNKRMYGYCHDSLECNLCKQVKFREKFCDIFPRHVMKMVRARISLADTLLNDADIDVRVILQVRDPRAVYLSRKTLEGCDFHPHCYNIEHYCNFLVEDYQDVQYLMEKYPNRIKILRYEDLALDPFVQTQQLFNFLRLPFSHAVKNFLNSHTIANQGDIYSTFRDSKLAASHWMKDLNASDVENVQKVCRQAMKLWRYKIIES